MGGSPALRTFAGRVRVPATTANLGPGFDSLGAALRLYLDLEWASGRGWSYEYAGPGRVGERPDGSLVRRAAALVAGSEPPVAMAARSLIPPGRGLGSSAAAVAAGLLLGCAVARRKPDRAALLELGTPLEGHPDNLAPALFGGLTLILPSGRVLRFEPDRRVRPILCVAPSGLATAEARAVLPRTVEHGAAVANVARAAGLLALLAGAEAPRAELLLECTEDLLHQPYRAPLAPATAEAVSRLRQAGVAAAVSGAGPSVVCLVVRGEEERARRAASGLEGWTLIEADWDLEGARIL